MAEEVQAGAVSTVPVSTQVAAEVNPENPIITVFSRSTGIEFQMARADAASLMRANPDLSYVKYDLDASVEDFLARYQAVEEVVLAMIENFRRLGYVPEKNEAAANAIWGPAENAYRVLVLAMGASLPTEGEVRSWSQHLDEHGGFDLEQHPMLGVAAEHQAAIDAYRAEQKAAQPK